MALTDHIFSTYVIAEEAVREIFLKIKQKFDLERIRTTQDIKAVEDKFDAIVSDNLTYDDLENIFFEPVVSNISMEHEDESVVLSALSENIKDDEEVTWHIYINNIEEPEFNVESKGTSLALTPEQAWAVEYAVLVLVSLECSDYTSDKFILKGEVVEEQPQDDDGPGDTE